MFSFLFDIFPLVCYILLSIFCRFDIVFFFAMANQFNMVGKLATMFQYTSINSLNYIAYVKQ